MAAWFVMLILLTSVLLAGAAKIEKPEWVSGFLAISAVLVVFVVISCVFMMLTRFRSHLQEGKEYASWLRDERRYSNKQVETLIVERKSFKELSNSATLSRENITKIPESTRIENLERFAEVSRVSVDVANCPDANQVALSLRELGFKSEIYTMGSKDEEPHHEHTAIWVGTDVSPRVALTAIRASVTIWPFLCYMHLSSDTPGAPEYIDKEIFIGGSTGTYILDATNHNG